MSSCYIFLLLSLQLSLVYGDSNATFRVIGGHPFDVEYANYMAVVRSSRGTCGGSLISMRHVVTAGHCVYQIQPNEISIVAGLSCLTDRGAQVQYGQAALIPSSFNGQTLEMDIAVILTRGAFTAGVNVGKIPLCTEFPQAGQELHVFGFGRTQENGPTSNDLMRGVVTIQDWEDCAQSFENSVVTFTEDKLCAPSAGVRHCKGDSGGPGVNSVGELCAVITESLGSQYPSVFINVKHCHVESFIRQALDML